MGRLDGRVAIITGGARGMGAAHAKRFLEEGAKLVITDILEAEGEAVARQLAGAGAIKFMKHDVTNAAEWQQVIAETEAAFGPVDVLVNNAGIALLKSIDKMTEAQFRRVIDVNQVSVFLGMKYVLPSMRKAGGGSIINISSISGLKGNEDSVAYSASKFAIRGMTQSAAVELGKEGIRVNSVHPGITETPMVRMSRVKKMANAIPLQRIAQPAEVSDLIVYLASEESSYVTGAEFVIDGGLSAKL